jgi:hypothetical protein
MYYVVSPQFSKFVEALLLRLDHMFSSRHKTYLNAIADLLRGFQIQSKVSRETPLLKVKLACMLVDADRRKC